MLTNRVIPCLDVDQGRVVKGVSFVDIKDAGDPAELASFYDAEGADELVFLDITASSDARDTMVDVVERVSAEVFIPLTVGGGIRSRDDMRRMLEAGAEKVSVNSAAVSNPTLIEECAQEFGSQCVVLAIDAKRVEEPALLQRVDGSNDYAEALWQVYTHGGRRRPHSTPSSGLVSVRNSEPVSCSSPVWTRMGNRRDTTVICSALSRRRCLFR